MNIAVIVPVRNEASYIARTLDALLVQDYPRDAYEIVVVDGESTDLTRQIAAEYAYRHTNVRLYDNPQCWSSAGRNIGIASSTSDVVLIVDGHCELTDRQYLTKVAEAFERSAADCVGRPQPLTVAKANPVQRAIGLARRSWLGHHPDSYVFSSGEGIVPATSIAVAYRRAVFDRIGMFDESFDACEDVEFNRRIDRANLVCFRTDQITLPYIPRGTLRGLFHQLARYGRGRVRLLRKHPDFTNTKALVPAALLGGVLIGGVTIGILPNIAIPYFASIGAYLATLSLTSAHLTIRARDLALTPLVVAALLTIHAGAGWGAICEVFSSLTSRAAAGASRGTSETGREPSRRS